MYSQFIISVDSRPFVQKGMLNSADQDFLTILKDTDPLHHGGGLSCDREV